MQAHRRILRLALALATVAAVPDALEAQSQLAAAVEDPFEPLGLGGGPYAEMSALLEVTIFNLDVLTLTVRIPPEAAARVKALVAGEEYSEELADSVASVMLATDDLWARQVFERNVSFGRLLGGMRESSRTAAQAGFISPEYYREFSSSLPVWFAFLEHEGAKTGDEIVFWVRGDTVRTLYRTVDGRVRMDQSGTSAEGRRGSVPGFFAPGSRFRERLVESLLRGAGPGP